MLKQLNDELKPLTNDFDEPGVTRFFGLGDIAAKSLLSGWAAPEDNHNWNDGLDAALLISLRQRPDDTHVLAVEGRPFITAGLGRQDVTLFVNGFRVGFWRLTDGANCRLEAELEPEVWMIRRGVAVAKCVFHLPDSTRPSDISSVQDHRQIGFCFQSLTIQPRRPFVRR
jgi:hypothetical protein